jgi:zinc transporter ZupT
MQGLLVTGLAGAITFGGGLIALRTEAHRGAVYAFCAGALIGTGLLALIPEALDLSSGTNESGYDAHALLLSTVVGFFLFYVLENLPHRETAHPDVLHHHHGHPTGLWGAAGLAVHSFIDGVAIGDAFDAASGLGWTLAVGITMHKFADGVSVAGVMRGTHQPRGATVGMLLLTAAAPIAGVLAEPLLDISPAVRVLLLGWFAGVFLYLGATSLLPAAHEAGGSRWLTGYAIAGAVLIYVAQILIGHIG